MGNLARRLSRKSRPPRHHTHGAKRYADGDSNGSRDDDISIRYDLQTIPAAVKRLINVKVATDPRCRKRASGLE